MKQTLFAAALLAVTGVAVAQTTSSVRDSKNPQFQVEIVSTDAVGKTITVQKVVMVPQKAGEMKPRTGGSTSTDTAPAVVVKVDDSVAAVLEGFKPGEMVVLTCNAAMPDEKGMAPASGTSPATKGPLSKCALVTAITKQ